MKSLEDIERQSNAIDAIMDIFAESGDKRMIFLSKNRKLNKKLMNIGMEKSSIEDEQFEALSNAIEQFNNIIDDILKEDK